MVTATSAIPSTSTTSLKTEAATTGLAKNFDNFMTLLTTQLKNQDPTSPMETNEFTNQIVQFTQVEQQIDTNKNLESLIALNKSVGVNNAVSYMGKKIEVESDQFNLKSGKSDISYELPSTANSVDISIQDSTGKTIKAIPSTDTGIGKHTISWDGKNSDGTMAVDGVYKIVVNAKDTAGAAIAAKTYTTDTVTQVEFAGDTTNLYMGTIATDMTKVKSVNSSTSDAANLQQAQIDSFNQLLKDINDGKAVSYIGRGVVAKGDTFNVTGGKANLFYQFPSDTTNAKASIYNSTGSLVRTIPVSGTSGAQNAVNWDGKDANGNQVADGTYSMKVTGNSSTGNSVPADSYFGDVVSYVQADGVNSKIFFGDLSVPISSISKVF